MRNAVISAVVLAPLALAAEPAKPAKTTPAKTSSSITTVLRSVLAPRTPSQTPGQKEAQVKGSHKEGTPIKVLGTDGKTRLQTLAADGEGRILALVAPPRSYGTPMKDVASEVQVYGGEGKMVTSWKVPFHAHAINAGPDNSVFVGGDGRVARFDRDGKALGEWELPFIKELLADKAGLRKEAEADLKAQRESFQKIVEQYRKRVKDLENVAEDKRSALQKRQLQQYRQILQSYAGTEKHYASQTVDALVASKLGRLRTINGLAVSDRDVFIACGDSKGYGFAIWRLTHDLKDARKVLAAIGGCCGQMDVQCCEGDLLVAENTKHQFARYDRDGKPKGAWGKRGSETDMKCFGGCCNPMNVRASREGEIYTAESEGLIKRFNGKGDFLGVVGYAPLTGGCKNVAVAVSPDGGKVYFADQPGSRIIVLEKKAE